MRGNRTTKINAENFNAFRSFNYPVLAEAGIHIKYNNVQIHANGEEHKLKPHYLLDTNVAVLKLFPGIQENVIATVLGIEGLKAIVLKHTVPAMLPVKSGLSEDFARPAHKDCNRQCDTMQCGNGGDGTL